MMWKCWQNPSCLDENHYLPIIITITISLFFHFSCVFFAQNLLLLRNGRQSFGRLKNFLIMGNVLN